MTDKEEDIAREVQLQKNKSNGTLYSIFEGGLFAAAG